MTTHGAPYPAIPGRLPHFERLREVHLHLHGVSAEDVAAIIGRQGLPDAGEE